MYELHVSISGPKDCDLPKAALTALHAGVNSFGQLPVGPNLADLGGGAGGGGSSGGVPVGGGVARLHISGGLCDNSNALNGGNGSSGNGNGNNNNGNGNGNNNNSMQQQLSPGHKGNRAERVGPESLSHVHVKNSRRTMKMTLP